MLWVLLLSQILLNKYHVLLMINMTMTAFHKNSSSFLRQPCKQGSASESIERTAWAYLPVSSCPTVVHWFEGSGWYSSTWQAKMISLLSSLKARLFNHTRYLSNNHLRSVGIAIITTAGHPDLTSYNWGTSTCQWPWQGGKWSPGLCSREEGEHRRESFGSTPLGFQTPSNDECLKMSNH